jgi:hypothetical protein
VSRLVLGPLLRRTSDTAASIWVETDRPCEVRVLDSVSPTFTVHGHHYALVEVDGLSPGSTTPYDVALDGETVWPEPGSPFPPSRIRTLDPNRPLRLAFGSCRVMLADTTSHGIDALAAFATSLAAGGSDAALPDVLLLLGDQVYADEPPPELRSFIRDRRGLDTPPGVEVANYAEYAELYRLAWGTDDAVRWLLSTVPTLMIFDDHDIHDDWNTSHTWREQMAATPWWKQRIVAGLGSYWVYQHLGNLSPGERAHDPLFQALHTNDRDDNSDALDASAQRADREPAGTRWSYHQDFGRTRLIVLDSRCGRILTPDRRAMLDDTELAWFDQLAHGDVDHLLIATSLPYLLPETVHHLEAWNEAVCEGAWGPRAARRAEGIRQGLDLEHWAAFDRSFRTVARTVLSVARGERGGPPASIAFLSGDVHYSYLALVTHPPVPTPIAQLVCSPLRNPLAGKLRLSNEASRFMTTGPPARLLARLAGVPAPPLRWRLAARPDFANSIATLNINDRHASAEWASPDSETSLSTRASAHLSVGNNARDGEPE